MRAIRRLSLAPPDGWYRGNLHTHTTVSDGDVSPQEVAVWYQDHGYDFVFLTDHDKIADVGGLSDPAAGFLVVSGEEVSAYFLKRAVHVVALLPQQPVAPIIGSSPLHTLQANVSAIGAVRGIPVVAHPNSYAPFGLAELLAVDGEYLLEVWSGNPVARNLGVPGVLPGVEATWDALLTKGRRVFGVAVDDAHHFKGAPDPSRLNPGRGWVMLRADSLSPESVRSAISQGEFYFSTGVELTDVVVEPKGVSLRLVRGLGCTYRTTFIGDGGVVLAVVEGESPGYRWGAGVTYVRAKITNCRAAQAWTQPAFRAR